MLSPEWVRETSAFSPAQLVPASSSPIRTLCVLPEPHCPLCPLPPCLHPCITALLQTLIFPKTVSISPANSSHPQKETCSHGKNTALNTKQHLLSLPFFSFPFFLPGNLQLASPPTLELSRHRKVVVDPQMHKGCHVLRRLIPRHMSQVPSFPSRTQ